MSPFCDGLEVFDCLRNHKYLDTANPLYAQQPALNTNPTKHTAMKTALYSICLLWALLIHSSISQAQTPASNPTIARPDFALPPLLPGTSILIKFDIARIKLPVLAPNNPDAASAKPSPELMERLVALQEILDMLKAAFGERPCFLLVDIPISPGQPILRIAIPASNEESNARITEFLARYDVATVNHPEGWLLAPLPVTWASLQTPIGFQSFSADVDETLGTWKGMITTPEPFKAALNTVANEPIQIAIVPPDYLWRTYEELLTELPEHLGGGPVQRLTQGFRWMAIGLDSHTMNFSATIQSASPEAARAFAPFASVLLKKVIEQLSVLPPEQLSGLQSAMAEKIQSQVHGDRIQYNLVPNSNSSPLVGNVIEFAENFLGTQMERELKPKLRQLALAVHNYESAYSCFPPAAKFRDAEGKSGLSWRVHILPFLDGGTQLYEQFKLDEPWDSPHNKPLIAKMPALFRTQPNRLKPAANDIPAGYTTLVAPVGEGTLFGGTNVVMFSKITDGTTATIMFVEVESELAVPWTAPQDYAFDPQHPAAGLKIGKNGKFHAAMADGSALEFPGDLPEKTIVHLYLMNDGHVISF